MKVIENNSQANWTMRKIKELMRDLEKVNVYAEDEKRLIEEWRVKEAKPLEDSIEHFKTLLMAYYTNNKANDPKFKLSVPHGKITTRKIKKFNYEDEEQLIEWLNIHHPHMIQTVRKFNKTEFKKSFKGGFDEDTGEVIPYLSITEEESHTFKFEEVEGLENE